MEWLVATNIIFDKKHRQKKVSDYLNAVLSSALSRSNLVPFQWYEYPKKAHKKILPTFSPQRFYGKTEWNSLQILRNKNLYMVHKYSFLNASNIPNGPERAGRGCELWVSQKISGCNTVKCFISLGLETSRGLTVLLWTTVVKATHLHK